eukprot:NODE_119_length_18186_cov_1.929397.p10 type:complete len:218 gc:universal NODE_119_length_18186_cov_1.929397:17884-17231(-)
MKPSQIFRFDLLYILQGCVLFAYAMYQFSLTSTSPDYCRRVGWEPSFEATCQTQFDSLLYGSTSITISMLYILTGCSGYLYLNNNKRIYKQTRDLFLFLAVALGCIAIYMISRNMILMVMLFVCCVNGSLIPMMHSAITGTAFDQEDSKYPTISIDSSKFNQNNQKSARDVDDVVNEHENVGKSKNLTPNLEKGPSAINTPNSARSTQLESPRNRLK